MEEQKLSDIFKFDEADLQANRRGNFSEKQKNDILKDKKRFENKRKLKKVTISTYIFFILSPL